MNMIFCGCGCGNLRPEIDNDGRPRHFLKGHNLPRDNKGHPYYPRKHSAETILTRPSVRRLSPTEAAYIAGIIDGEGHITAWLNQYRGRMNSRCILGISNANPNLVEYLLKTIGVGRVSIDKSFRPNMINHKKVVRYYAGTMEEILGLLEQVIDYLVIKKRQAELMIRLVKLKLSRKKTAERKHNTMSEDNQIIRELLDLNHRGIKH
jgi:hypothetical protein